MRARYAGTCRLCGSPIHVDEEIDPVGPSRKRQGWAHTSCVVNGPEYQEGRATANRQHMEREVYGPIADEWAAEEDFNRYWKYGED
jgi:hypothetical protein